MNWVLLFSQFPQLITESFASLETAFSGNFGRFQIQKNQTGKKSSLRLVGKYFKQIKHIRYSFARLSVTHALETSSLSGEPCCTAIANGLRLNSLPIDVSLQLVSAAYRISVASPEKFIYYYKLVIIQNQLCVVSVNR